MDSLEDKHIILFDGVCNLCNGFVQFVIKNDSENYFQFAPLQSEIGTEIQKKAALNPKNLSSVVYYKNGEIHTKSTAALEIGKKLKKWSVLSSILFIFPKFFRDFIYDFIAKNRYKWYGKTDSCMIPTPELQNKFLS